MNLMQLVILHDNQISVRYLIDRFTIGHMQGLHERSHLTKEGVVARYLEFAIILPTFLAKDDSIIKFWTEMRE